MIRTHGNVLSIGYTVFVLSILISNQDKQQKQGLIVGSLSALGYLPRRCPIISYREVEHLLSGISRLKQHLHRGYRLLFPVPSDRRFASNRRPITVLRCCSNAYATGFQILLRIRSFSADERPIITKGILSKGTELTSLHLINFQSLVLLTVLPLFGLFSHVIEAIAYGFFDSGESAIETGSVFIIF